MKKLKYFLDHPNIKRGKSPGNGGSPYSEKAQEVISSKMSLMKGEDKPHKQKVAIAMSEASEKGLNIPKEKKKK